MSRVRQGGGFGVVILLVVMAAILLLASRAWKSVMPTALEVASPANAEKRAAKSLDVPPAPVNSGAGQRQIQSSLSDAQKKTDVHSAQVEKALKE